MQPGPFTSPHDEVTDIQELASSLAEQPLGFTENHFPTKLLSDVFFWNSSPIRSKFIHPEGISANPTITFLAEEGFLSGKDVSALNPIPLRGYKHLDVLTAAAHQNNGRPEIVSTRLAGFATG
ncbi:hypothetical protein AB0E01_43535 [Nocardia vinacea]|uniref:hypothetical protein n=1 Tax=Nocardia vinacea TaxID=96468 RepID=UPI0033E66D19